LQAYKNALGKDYTDRPAIRWMTMRWAYDIFPKDDKPWYPCRQIGGNATYGTEDFLGSTKGGGFSHGGWFSQGFGVIPEADKPALLWTYQNFVAKAMKDDYDIRNYPHRAVLSFINWPIGMTAKNPAEILPKVRFDSLHGYISFRNNWKCGEDILVTGWTAQGPRGWAGRSGPSKPGMTHGDVIVWAYGQRADLGSIAGGKGEVVWSTPDGSGLFTNGNRQLAVDYSKTAGVDALIVSNSGSTSMGLDARLWNISRGMKLGGMSLIINSISQTGIHPVPQLNKDGDRIIIGGQSIMVENGNIVFKPLEGVAPGMGAKTLDARVPLAVILKKKAEEEKRKEVPRAEVVLPADAPVMSFSFDTIDLADGKQSFLDSSPNKLVATVKGKPVSVDDGVSGKAVLLNGEDNVLIVEPNKAVDMAGKSVSISCWFKNISSEPGGEVVLLEKNVWRKDQTPDCYSSCIDSSNKFGFNTVKAGNHPRTEIPWYDGLWHHVVSVFDAKAKSISIYCDGKEIGSMKNLPGTCQIGEGSAPLTMGARGAAKPASFFGCMLDEMVMYDRPLTRGEVVAMYEKGAATIEAAKTDVKPD
ncbi:MAG: LamG-like jellyroll fold domain-containing protein, partial [bacterium]